jgi:hypothetical protein
MVKVQIFKHMSHSALSEKINTFIADNKLEPDNIHDIKLASGPENSIVVMVIYMEPESDNFLDDEYDKEE